jgi:uncharacterized protein YndB with AHSA1/START domain
MSASEVETDGKHAGVQVVRTVDAPVAQVWQTLISSSGAEALLGPGAVFGGKGEPWHSDEGPSGVLRSYHPHEQLRLSWHEAPDAPASIVELDLSDDSGATRIDLRHDRLDGDRSAYEQRWNGALDRLDQAVRG